MSFSNLQVEPSVDNIISLMFGRKAGIGQIRKENTKYAVRTTVTGAG